MEFDGFGLGAESQLLVLGSLVLGSVLGSELKVWVLGSELKVNCWFWALFWARS